MSRVRNTLLTGALLLTAPLTLVAQQKQAVADQRQPTLADLQQVVQAQQKMLEKQQQLIEQQSAELQAHRDALSSLSTRLDQVAVTATGQAPQATQQEITLRERLSRVEDQLENPPDAPDVLRAGDFPGSFEIPGTNLSARMGGFVRLGIVDSLDPIGSDDRFVVGSIPVGPDEMMQDFTEGVTISAKRSRLNLDVRMDSSVGQFRAFLEGDFAGEGDGEGETDTYRLRHAFGQYKQFIVGQTWSTLMDRHAEPEEIDFEGLNAQINVRQPLVRFTKGQLLNRPFALGLEDPATDITGGTGITSIPDVTIAFSKSGSWGRLQLGSLLRSLTGELDLTSTDESTFGWGLTTSGNISVTRRAQQDNFKFQLSYGKGLGRYVNDLSSVGGKDAIVDPQGNLLPYPVFAGYISYQHWWQRNPLGLFKDMRSSVVVGYVDLENFDFEASDAYNRTIRTSINWIWSPISSVDVGLEYLWGRKWVKNNDNETARQFQGVMTFRF